MKRRYLSRKNASTHQLRYNLEVLVPYKAAGGSFRPYSTYMYPPRCYVLPPTRLLDSRMWSAYAVFSTRRGSWYSIPFRSFRRSTGVSIKGRHRPRAVGRLAASPQMAHLITSS